MLSDKADKENLKTISQWAEERNCSDLYNLVNKFEDEIKRLKKNIAKEKKTIELKFKKGF